MTEAPQTDVIDDVDPDIRRFVDALNAGYAAFPDFASLPLPERRAAAEKVREPWRQGGPEMAETSEHVVGGVRLRIHRPVSGGTLPAMLYMHGGGWTMFSIDTHDRLMREYAARAGIVVAGIDYSLAPEAKFPAALTEVAAAFGWLRIQAEALGIDAARIAVGGDSAGANLALAVSVMLVSGGEPAPAAILLNYGALLPEPTASYALYDGPRYMLTVPEMNAFWANYVQAESNLANPLVAPGLADLKGLPPTFLCVAECDILAECNRIVAGRLRAAGVETALHVYPGATHSFLEAMSISPLANSAIDDAAQWLQDRLSAR